MTRLVHEHRASLVRVARGEGLAAEDAFDVVQEAFHTFLERAEKTAVTGGDEGARKLLVALTRNEARNRRRLHAVSRPHEQVDGLAADDPSVEELIASAEEHVRLAGCLRSLGDVQRAVVTLRMLDEAPGDSVARTFGSSASTDRNGTRSSHVRVAARCTMRYASSRARPASTSARSTGWLNTSPYDESRFASMRSGWTRIPATIFRNCSST